MGGYRRGDWYACSDLRRFYVDDGRTKGLDIPKIMKNWVSKVRAAPAWLCYKPPMQVTQMGFPVIAVTETSTGIKVRQDRFLEEGPAKPEDNETIWYVFILILINP